MLCFVVFSQGFYVVFVFFGELPVSSFEFGIVGVFEVLDVLGVLRFVGLSEILELLLELLFLLAQGLLVAVEFLRVPVLELRDDVAVVVLVDLSLLPKQLLLLLLGQRVLLVLVVEHARVVVSQLGVFGLEVVFERRDAVLLLGSEFPVPPFEFGVVGVLQVLEVLGVLGLLGFPQFSQLFLVLLPGQGVLLVSAVQSGSVVVSEFRVLCIVVRPESFQLAF